MPYRKEAPPEEKDPLKSLFNLFTENKYVSKGTTGVFRMVLLSFLFDQWRILQSVPDLTRKIDTYEQRAKTHEQDIERIKTVMRQNGWQVSTKHLLGDTPVIE